MSAGDALTQYKASLNEAGKATSKFSTVTKTLGSAFKTIGAFALNTAVVAGITVAISAAAKAWDDYSKSQENAIESGNQALSTMEENQNKISSAQDLLDSIKADTVTDVATGQTITRFEQLSQGVNSLGENVSLTQSEFAEYNSLLDQMSSAGLTTTNSLSNLEEQVKNLRKSTNMDTLEGLSDWVDSFNAQNNQKATDFTKELGFQQNLEALEKIQDIASGKISSSEGEKTSFWEKLGLAAYGGEMISQAGQSPLTKQAEALREDGEKALDELLNDKTFERATKELADKYSLDIFDKKGNIDASKLNTSEMKQQISDVIEQEQTLLESAVRQSSGFLEALFQNNPVYDKLPEEISNKMSGIFSQIDYDTISEYMMNDQGMVEEGLVRKWVNNLARGLDNTDVQSQLEELFTLDTKKNELTFKDYKSQANDLVDSITSAVPELSEDVLKKTSGIQDTFDELQSIYNRVSKLYGKNFADTLSLGDLDLAADIVTNEDITTVEEFSKALQGLKVSADANTSFEQFSSTISSTIENLQTMQDILSESASGLSISSENLDTFRSMFGDDAERALERTANGYHINRQALAELQEQQNESIRTDYLSSLNAQYDELRKINEDLAKTALIGGDVSGLLTQKEGIESQISALQDLQMEYQAANSAYQQWINAQSSTNERDMYEKIQSGYETTKDSIERGWVDDDVRTYVDLLSNMDLATASAQEVVAEFNRLGESIGNSGYSILDFFTVDEDGNPTTDGIYNFFDTVNSVLGEEFAKINENGEYEFDFGDGKDQEVADALKMDVEAVQAILRAATDAGFETNLDQPIESLEELRTSAEAAKKSLTGMNDTTLSDINLDSSSLEDVNNQIQKTQEYIEAVENDETIDPNVQTDKIEAANDILDYLVLKKQELTETTEIQVELNDEEVLQLLESDNEKLKELGKTKVTFDFEADLSEISSQISEAQSLVEQFQNDKGVVDLSVEGATEAVSILQALLSRKEQLSQPAVMAIDTSQVDGELGAAIGKIQEFQQALSDLNVAQGLADAGVDIDTSAAQQKVQDLAGQIQNLDGNTKASLGLDTSEFDTALSTIQNQKVDVQAGVNLDQASLSTISSSISAISPEVLVKAGVDPAAVDAYDPADKDAEVKYTVNAAKVNAWNAPDKNATVIYSPDTSGLPNWIPPITRTVKYEATGDVGVNGTAHAEGTANASGNWGIKRGGTSLVGELGQEILVRDSKFYTIGDHGAEFINTKPGDIIFNHKQSEALLKNGYVTSRGKMIGGNANANGSAYSSGSGGLGRPSRPSSGMGSSSNTSNNSSTNKTTQSVNKAANNLSSAAKETSKAAEKLSETLSGYTDWIERVFEARERELEHLESQLDRIAHLPDRQAKTYEILAKNREYMNNTQSAKQTYQSHLNMLEGQMGLDPTILNQIRSGSFDISKYDDETQSLISEYQEYYDKLQDCSAQYDQLIAQQEEYAQTVLDNISDYYDMMNGVDESAMGWLEGQRELWENQGKNNDFGNQYSSIRNSMAQQQKVSDRLQKQVDDFAAEIERLISEGYMQRYSQQYFEAHETLNGFKQELYESQSALIEFEDQLRELDYTAIQNKIDGFAQAVDKISAQINLMEARDQKVPESVYQQQIDANNNQIVANQQLRASKLKEQGLYDVGSTRYQELAEEINDLDVETLNLMADNEALKDSIYELRFANLDNQIEAYGKLKDEIEDFRSLLNEDAFFAKNGGLTEEGLAELALLQQGIATSKNEIADYREGLEKLKKSYANGVISLDEYNEKSEEYCAGIRDSIKDVSDYEDALTDLYMTQMRTENEALQEIIDKRREALQAKESYYQYDQKLKSQTKDVNMLQAQIQALEGVFVCPIYFNCWKSLRDL